MIIPSGVLAPYVISGFSGPGALASQQVILGHRFPVLVTFVANFAPITLAMFSSLGAFVDAAGMTVLNIDKCLSADDPTVGGNWVTIGTATFSAGGHAASLATAGGIDQVFDAYDHMRILGPTSPDSSLSQIEITLVGKR